MQESGGNLTYDGVIAIKYLEAVVNETMWIYPHAFGTERVCTKGYQVPGTSFLIEKGTIINIPIHGVHQNPAILPNPKMFDPDRFTGENKAGRHQCSFLAFGQGPQNCIGMKFAVVEVKAALGQLVYSFHFSPCHKTAIPLELGRHPNVKPRTPCGSK